MSGDALNFETSFSLPIANADTDDLPTGELAVTADVSGLTIYGTEAQLQKYAAGAANVKTEVHPVEAEIKAPISEGTFLGTVDYVLDGVILHTASLIAQKDVRAETEIRTQQGGEDIAATPVSEPGSTPLIKRPGLSIGVFGWLMIALIALLIALIAVFVVSERKRRRERARRRSNRAHQHRKQ